MGASVNAVTALAKARAYCARQERCQQEVRDKLFTWQVPAQAIEGIIAQLIGEGFLSEARFAEHFAVSKFRQKGWGRRKIEQALRLRQVSEPCITSGLKAIEEDEYNKGLEAAIARRWARLKDPDAFRRRQLVKRYFIGRGFPAELVERLLENVVDG